MFGTYSWAGIYQGLPAIVLSYHGGAELWVLSNEKWISIAEGSAEKSIIPRKCEKCGSQIPIINDMKDFMTQRLSQSRERAWNFIGPLAKWLLE